MSEYDAIIVAALFGFLLLAFILLAPVYRFLQREERASRQWTAESLAERAYASRSENGKPGDEEEELD